jgi:hypothetical protein
MRAVWEIGKPAPARVVHAHVAKEHRVEPLTVIDHRGEWALSHLFRLGLPWRPRRRTAHTNIGRSG